MAWLEFLLRPLFALTAVLYVLIALRVVQSRTKHANSVMAFMLFLIGVFVAGSAFCYGTDDPGIYGIGRVLVFFASGFMPVAFYIVYREYTVGPPGLLMIALLSIVPVATTLLALTNSMHELIWVARATGQGIAATGVSDHAWFNRVHAPFMYGLFIYTAIALSGRLPTIAPAHRRTVLLLLVCALLPFTVSVGNIYLGIGPPDFPFSSLSFVVMLPIYTYAAVSTRFFEFSPIAYQTLFDHVRDPIFVLDQRDRIACANRSAQELLGRREAELLGRSIRDDFPDACEIVHKAAELDLTQTLRINSEQVYELSVAPLLGPKGQNLGSVVVCRDVTERRKAQSLLADSEHLVRTLIETSSNGILRFASEGGVAARFRCVFANRAAETLLGLDTGGLVGMPLEKITQLEPDRLIRHFTDETQNQSLVSFEMSGQGADSNTWLRVVGEPVGEDFSVTLIDITQRKRNEDKMLADALRDPLTGVLNRRGFELEGRKRIRSQARGAVLYLDLNHFKTINDRFGHRAGDALLKAFGHRLEFCLRPEDILGRLGGDEFAVILPDIGEDEVRRIVDRLVQTASEAYIIQGEEIRCTASVGVALMPQHGEELWTLISVADQAMYDAKAQSTGTAANDGAAFAGSRRQES